MGRRPRIRFDPKTGTTTPASGTGGRLAGTTTTTSGGGGVKVSIEGGGTQTITRTGLVTIRDDKGRIVKDGVFRIPIRQAERAVRERSSTVQKRLADQIRFNQTKKGVEAFFGTSQKNIEKLSRQFGVSTIKPTIKVFRDSRGRIIGIQDSVTKRSFRVEPGSVTSAQITLTEGIRDINRQINIHNKKVRAREEERARKDALIPVKKFSKREISFLEAVEKQKFREERINVQKISFYNKFDLTVKQGDNILRKVLKGGKQLGVEIGFFGATLASVLDKARLLSRATLTSKEVRRGAEREAARALRETPKIVFQTLDPRKAENWIFIASIFISAGISTFLSIKGVKGVQARPTKSVLPSKANVGKIISKFSEGIKNIGKEIIEIRRQAKINVKDKARLNFLKKRQKAIIKSLIELEKVKKNPNYLKKANLISMRDAARFVKRTLTESLEKSTIEVRTIKTGRATRKALTRQKSRLNKVANRLSEQRNRATRVLNELKRKKKLNRIEKRMLERVRRQKRVLERAIIEANKLKRKGINELRFKELEKFIFETLDKIEKSDPIIRSIERSRGIRVTGLLPVLKIISEMKSKIKIIKARINLIKRKTKTSLLEKKMLRDNIRKKALLERSIRKLSRLRKDPSKAAELQRFIDDLATKLGDEQVVIKSIVRARKARPKTKTRLIREIDSLIKEVRIRINDVNKRIINLRKQKKLTRIDNRILKDNTKNARLLQKNLNNLRRIKEKGGTLGELRLVKIEIGKALGKLVKRRPIVQRITEIRAKKVSPLKARFNETIAKIDSLRRRLEAPIRNIRRKTRIKKAEKMRLRFLERDHKSLILKKAKLRGLNNRFTKLLRKKPKPSEVEAFRKKAVSELQSADKLIDSLVKVKRVVRKATKIETRPGRLLLESERVFLRKQQVIENKLGKGLSVKVSREAPASRGGEPVWPFKDAKTGKIRFFTTRKSWLSAIKRQVKSQRVKAPELAAFFKLSDELGKVVENKFLRLKDGVKLVDKKGKTIIEIRKPTPKSKQEFVEVRAGEQVLLQEVKTKSVQKQITRLKQVKKSKIKQKSKVVEESLKKENSKSISNLRNIIRTNRFGKLKLVSRSMINVLVLSTVLSGVLAKQGEAVSLRLVQSLRDAQLQGLILGTVFAQRQGVGQKQFQALKQLQVQIQKQAQGQIQRQKLIQAQVLVSRRKTLTKKKPLIPPEFERKKQEKLKKLVDKSVKGEKLIFIPDLYSVIYDVKASLAEKKLFLRAGRLFTGFERRKLIKNRRR